ncbi:MAG TPA: YjbQ family protein [Chloroflexi bacterium]|nr:YjbQ family protein [Chloroflexota bacterium]
MEQIGVSTTGHQGFYDITAQVQQAVANSGVQEGICLVFCPHTTAGVTLNENWDPAVRQDMGVGLDAISPPRSQYRHGEDNSPAHIKCSLVGASQCVPISASRLLLGRWQGIYLAEFDGPRRRQIIITALAG